MFIAPGYIGFAPLLYYMYFGEREQSMFSVLLHFPHYCLTLSFSFVAHIILLNPFFHHRSILFHHAKFTSSLVISNKSYNKQQYNQTICRLILLLTSIPSNFMHAVNSIAFNRLNYF